MELTRKLKTRRQHRGQPCTNNTDNIWRESRMTSSRLHGQRTFRPNLMTSAELVSLVCSTLTMHCDCVQYQQGAADFNPWVCILAGHVTGGLCSGVFSFMVFANGVSTLHLWCHFIYGDFGDPLAWITFRSRLWIDRYGHMPLPTDKVFVSFVRWLLEFRTPMPESKIEATGWSNNASPSHCIPGRKLNLHHFCFRWTCGICSTCSTCSEWGVQHVDCITFSTLKLKCFS